MIFDDFVTKWTGKPVDFDGIYPNQCMDLMHQYVYDVLGITDKTVLAAPAAYLAYTNNYPQYFDKIDNTPTGVPQKGDIVFFGQKIGEFGHVCIFSDGDANKFNSFDANWPIGSLPHIQEHDYNGVLGWLRPKPQEAMATITQKELDTIIADRDKNWNLYQADETTITNLNATIQRVQNESGAKDSQVQSLTTQISTLTEQLSEKDKQIESLQNQLKQGTDSGKQLTQCIADRKSYQDQIEALNRTIGQLKRGKPQTFIDKLIYVFS